MSDEKQPYKTLGKHLQYVREQSRQSVLEVSGAVEIDKERLERIEAGLERPAEDILLLLISHFGVGDREAVQLWELANYDTDIPEQIRPDTGADAQFNAKNVVMLVGFDTRTIYSDGMELMLNDSGVTLNFTQTTGPSQHLSVAKVGMSYQQAEQVLETLQKAVLRARYLGNTKLLPSHADKTNKKA